MVLINIVANGERICEEAAFYVLPVHLHSAIGFCFAVER
jgi:hypothetical protein